MHGEGARDRVLDALEDLLVEEGLSGVTLEAVADRAAVSKGGLLYHFPTRKALLAGLVARMAEQSRAQLDDELERGGSVAALYLSLPDASLHRELLRPLLATIWASPEIGAVAEDILRTTLSQWKQHLHAEFPDDPVRAELIRLVGDGLVLSHLTGQPTPPEVIGRIRTTLLAEQPR
jgi:AcrR family transcriptional regulator